MVGALARVIIGVAAEEMLHLAITANLLSALGASPHLSRPNLPQPAHQYPPGVTIALLPFGEQSLRHFLYLERPEGMALDDAEGLAVLDEAVPVLAVDDLVPRLQNFATVGHLYRSIEAGLARLVGTMGEQNLFIGPPGGQITSSTFDWPQMVAITDLDSARSAIDTIVAQGEGTVGDWRTGHFGRFKAVLDEFLEARLADPDFDPARPVAAAGLHRDEERPRITDPVTASVADLFNVAYEVLLLVLYRLLARIDETDEEVLLLAEVAIGIIRDVMSPIAGALSTLPIGPEAPGLWPHRPSNCSTNPTTCSPIIGQRGSCTPSGCGGPARWPGASPRRCRRWPTSRRPFTASPVAWPTDPFDPPPVRPRG